MPDRPKILVLEADDALASRITGLLEDRSWEVVRQKVSKEALLLLEKSKPAPFDLFVSSYQLPKMAGDDVLKAAKAISPLTQRMLLVPSNQAELVIRAINKAEIHACLVTPATDQDLISQVSTCLDAFRKNRKTEQLKRLTVHQNKQMFQIAQKLKKKDKIFQDKISEKKAEILLLRSKLKANTPEAEPATLAQRVLALGIALEPRALKKEFTGLADYVLALIDSAAAKAGMERGNHPAMTLQVKDQEDNTTGPATSSGLSVLADKIIKAALASPGAGQDSADPPIFPDGSDQGLEETIEITLSEDMTQAFARFTTPPDSQLMVLNEFLDLLRLKEVTFGILNDEALESWLGAPGSEPFCVAKGEPPVVGQDGSVTYNFETDYTNPGKIMEDGRIDFRDRGSIPFVSKGDILAAKLPPKQGKNGVTVSGEAIVVDEPFDPVFIAGNGTRMSDDATAIIADLDGQPHLDHLGEISVNPELPINGDVDFQTGNIDFNGHIIVSGTVKEGFTVKGFSLTAKEIEGATIDLTGDLHISDGITDADIISSGNIYAKFINNSKAKAFGDVFIQKEIIDSKIMISGKCDNTSGVIISSKVSAKGGIEAGKVGTSASKPVLLKVGVNEHLNFLTDQLESRLKSSVDRLAEVREKIREVEDKDQDLYGQITEKAQVQEASQNRLKALKQEIAELKKANDSQGLTEKISLYKTEEQTGKAAEKELNTIFEIQNRFAKQIANYKTMIDQIEETNKNLVLRKKGLKEFGDKTESVPRVRVAKSITQDTVISGPNISLTLKEDHRSCQIAEKGVAEEGLRFFEIEITDL